MKRFLDEDIVRKRDGSLGPEKLVIRPYPKPSKTKNKSRKEYLDLDSINAGLKKSYYLPKEIKPVRINRDSLTSCTVYE